MLAIICFDLIPDAMKISNTLNIIIGVILGVLCMIICDILVQNKFNSKYAKNKGSNLLKTGIVVSIGIALHNFPEGLAIGSGFSSSLALGYSLALAICFHDIPEGISMAIPMKTGGMKKSKILFYVFMSGITTGIGAFFGSLVGGISTHVISLCLSFSAGAMLYIVSGELIPESNKLWNGRIVAIGNIIGFILGIAINQF